jgi:hypothetical protein
MSVDPKSELRSSRPLQGRVSKTVRATSDSNFKQQNILAARCARVVGEHSRPLRTEGAGKTGCALHPRSRVQNAHSKNAHEHTGSAETLRPSLRSGFNGFLRALPGDRAFLPPSPSRKNFRENLTPASGCQDHTTSPSASVSFVWRAKYAPNTAASTASRPAFVTIASRPSVWDGMALMWI